MARRTRITWALVLIAGVASAQTIDRAVPMQASPKNGGTYHVATRTWTHSGAGKSLRTTSGVLYNNTAPTGTFGTAGSPRGLNWTDEGRLPAPDDPVQGDGYSYRIAGFQVGYCADGGGDIAPLRGGWDFYNAYTACANPRLLTPDFSTGNVVIPGNPTTASADCWLVTFDLSGSSLEFELGADQESHYDGSSSLENFGWQVHLENGPAGDQFGPILSYDPSGYFGCAALEGDGTQFQEGSCTSPYSFGNYGSGLGLKDNHYSWSSTANPTYPNGCHWFGGYDFNRPASGFWLVVRGLALLLTPHPRPVPQLRQLLLRGKLSILSARVQDLVPESDSGHLLQAGASGLARMRGPQGMGVGGAPWDGPLAGRGDR